MATINPINIPNAHPKRSDDRYPNKIVIINMKTIPMSPPNSSTIILTNCPPTNPRITPNPIAKNNAPPAPPTQIPKANRTKPIMMTVKSFLLIIPSSIFPVKIKQLLFKHFV